MRKTVVVLILSVLAVGLGLDKWGYRIPVRLSPGFCHAIQANDLHGAAQRATFREHAVVVELAKLHGVYERFEVLEREMQLSNLHGEENNDELAIENDRLDEQIARLRNKVPDRTRQEADEEKLAATRQAIDLYEIDTESRPAGMVLNEMTSLSGPLDACRTVVDRMLAERRYRLRSSACRGITWQ